MYQEGEIVRIADRIAYVNHDVDDALRAGSSPAMTSRQALSLFSGEDGRQNRYPGKGHNL